MRTASHLSLMLSRSRDNTSLLYCVSIINLVVLICVSVESITSVPYTRARGVSLVALLGVQRYAQSTSKSLFS